MVIAGSPNLHRRTGTHSIRSPPRNLKLTRFDDEIYKYTMREFREFATAPRTSLVALDED
ncbi:hypothetical protein H4582DRAFT_1952429 [Lactarius indigo]|nr:hypothetical protein H4582DRAFT_1952429 [Lactarius indigo]